MIPFKLSDELIEEIELLIVRKSDVALRTKMEDFHYADIAEIINELNFEHATYIIKLLDSEKTSEVLTELDENIREQILGNLSAKEIADEISKLDTDDAV